MPRMDQTIEPMQIDFPDVDLDREDVFVVQNPTMDLDAYAATYRKTIKIQRLMFIAKHCPSLAVDALRICATEIKSTFNTDKYKEIITKLQEAVTQNEGSNLPPGQAPEIDLHWVETTDKKASMRFDRLDLDLKTYRNNSIKESIRRGHDDLGDHFLDCGHFSDALKCYSRARDYCICAAHIVNMCINVINVSIFSRNWIHVQTYINKVESVPDFFEISSLNDKHKQYNAGILAKLKCANGLAELSQKSYIKAARHFLEVSFDNLDYGQVLSPSDVAIYGGICALATFDRQELHKKVLSSSSFKHFLELQPQLRDILYKFYASQYATCLDLLNKMKDNLLLDMFLSPHVNKLYSLIRNRALIQYFSPYKSADLNRMATSFNCTVRSLEDELTQLILDGQISARIDSGKKILYARDVDQRSVIYEKALEVGKQFERKSKALVLRTIVLKNNIQVSASKQQDDTSR
ncbi:COP9 signalosome complex subunit 1-like isoform X2 [Clytia hemisphaerica]|uniref:COP9 signalosome complex subunit 1-like isoform X2 n=1 Tax=Clytia hemisphaerica TaxID=252671 RepID=UPI0034D54D70